jgi:DNA invertase Pin-like site-specific DNA recombinase
MKIKRKMDIEAVGYLRTSSASNVGQDKDSERRQRVAVERYARAAGYRIVDWFYDAAVSGADPIESRPGFARLLDRIESNGVGVVLVEDASRFARDLVAQELGLLMLVKRHVRVLTANGDDMTQSNDPSRVMMRQIAGSFSQYEKARLVAKLKAARDRRKAEVGKCGGRKSYAESNPQLVATAKQIKRERRHISLRKISEELARRGFLTPSGRHYAATAVQSMLKSKKGRSK